MRNRYSLSTLLLALLLSAGPAQAQRTVKKVVLQAFWWDYYNDNYRFKWADYLADLAPRLKSLGIDAVWIPPTPKNKNATNDVGYSPFDAYDLGDKFQKGDVRTRFGSKDEYLRLVAVLHANGIEVIQDVVLNHVDGAGTATGAGGQDPEQQFSLASNSGYKTFRYASFGTPLPETGDSGAAYAARRGRWAKNYPNFHPHLGHNTTEGEQAAPYFGPDFCFGNDGGADGYGGVSAAYLSQFPGAYNPGQGPGYSQTQARNWAGWLKKQTGVDGFRWDAVKHFSYNLQQDVSYNLKYNAGWASGGEAMFNVGEYVGGQGQLDDYVNSVRGQNGGQDFLMGTFDFGLREGLYNLVAGNGGFDVGRLPGLQQNQRVAYYAASNTYVHRTVPFVNNHDTFRPQLSASGNYTGWNTGQELAPHIDPFGPRLSAAYAVALAVDGSPQIFIEDLLDLGGTGKRFSHQPGSATDLPVRSDLQNLIWCHQNLEFKDGAYKVRWQAPDHLIIERSARALIGINDSWDQWQENYVDSDFAPGTVLKDYSGANGTYTYTVPADQRVRINTPPCNGSALLGRRGYSVWAPVGQEADQYQPPRAAATTQEWEMADDLGDLNCGSLGQGGGLPANSTNTRLAGKIFVQSGQPVTYELYPETGAGNASPVVIGVYDLRGNLLSSATGTASATGSYTPTSTGWLALKVRNATSTAAGQRAFVKATYTAPAAVDTRAVPAPTNQVAIWTANNNSADPADCRNWEAGLTPTATLDVLVPAGTSFAPALNTGTLAAQNLTIESGASLTLAAGTTLRVSGNLVAAGSLSGPGTLTLNGATEQTLRADGNAALALGNLTINNTANVRLLSPASVSGTLNFSQGHLVLGPYDLTLTGTATISGADANNYIITPNAADATAGYVVQPVPADGQSIVFPVGTAASYTPLALSNSGTAANFRVRTFDGLLTNGTSGAPYARAAEFVNRTWQVLPDVATGPVVSLRLQYNAADQNADYDASRASLYRNAGGPADTWAELGPAPATGNGPFTATYPGLSSFASFALGNSAERPLPVTLVRFAGQRTGAGSVHLSWATAQEADNAGFEVEKSADGRRFRRLATVAAHGSGGPARYAYTDPDAHTAAYYRLRQLDLDGHSQCSAAIYVLAGASPFVVTPNPSHGSELLQILGGSVLAEQALLRLTLRTVQGRVLLAPAPALRAHLAGQLNETLRQAAPGVYILTLTGPDGLPQHLRLVRE